MVVKRAWEMKILQKMGHQFNELASLYMYMAWLEFTLKVGKSM